MISRAAFMELKALVLEASTVLGERRAALVAGCNPPSIRSWLARSTCLLHTSTAEEVLPRLRRWHLWLPGYLEEKAEILHLEREVCIGTPELAGELGQRLRRTKESCPWSHIVTGCEVPDRLLMQILLGFAPSQARLQIVQALGHIRHVGAWPQPLASRKRVPAEPA